MAELKNRHSAAGAAATELILDIFRVNGLLLAEGDRLTSPLGLTSARWQVMGALAAGRATVAQIARMMGLRRQSVQRLADVLETEGLIAFEPNPNHRRAMLVSLTAKGLRKYAQVSEMQVEWVNRLSEGMNPRTLAAASAVLAELQRRMQETTANDDE
jgi:DNA-binding MarR family transcriptional regulator